MTESYLAIVASLIAAMATVIVFYLRTLREHQLTKQAETVRRLERTEVTLERLTQVTGELDRQFATKEEWLRESMHTRRRLETVCEAVARLEACRGVPSCCPPGPVPSQSVGAQAPAGGVHHEVDIPCGMIVSPGRVTDAGPVTRSTLCRSDPGAAAQDNARAARNDPGKPVGD